MVLSRDPFSKVTVAKDEQLPNVLLVDYQYYTL